MKQPPAPVPLVVDMDGTLLRTDTLLESLFAAARAKPLWLLQRLLSLPWAMARLKQDLTGVAALDAKTLPIYQPLVDYLREQKRLGRILILATGSDYGIAMAVANRCALFDKVLASDGTLNLSGESKKDRLVSAYGIKGFDYIGNSSGDLPVWASARQGWAVNPSVYLRSEIRRMPHVQRFNSDARIDLASYISAIRVSHWMKNLLLLVPLLLDHKQYDSTTLFNVFLALACFCLAASGVYLLNDLLDLGTDRQHPHKRRRALASGALPIQRALVLLAGFWWASWCIAMFLPSAFRVCLFIYLLLMLVYTLYLKNIPFVDAATLAVGYCLRITAGALAAGALVSSWLLTCSGLMFFGLALLKRYAEMVTLRDLMGVNTPVRGYSMDRASSVAGVGISACCVACGLFAYFPLAIAAGEGRLATWMVGALSLLWVAHMWMMAYRGRIQDDPVSFALHDPASRVLGLLTLTASLADI
ncbi:UbiA family prenyltransferase [Rhodoferax lacus]|uniref:UbiA family prenyltransferase n=1 Tax=Rhodoferax lacus TaxID=2184758 RepID=A0A3E1R620_9BURK|nr:UbiA family prenyltransferase [Rhodoferax lacus]RFO94815.1 UbiA family prenyltransferase [Rhodoferax lacus]